MSLLNNVSDKGLASWLTYEQLLQLEAEGRARRTQRVDDRGILHQSWAITADGYVKSVAAKIKVGAP